MKKYWCVSLITVVVALYQPLVQSAPLVMASIPISLGTVNGDVINESLIIERALSNPVLLAVTQEELDDSLRSLFINQAKFITNQKGNITVMVSSPVQGGRIETVITVGVWLDGKKVEVLGETRGSGVNINVSTSFKALELRVSEPLKIQLPKSYRGPLDFNFDIEAQS